MTQLTREAAAAPKQQQPPQLVRKRCQHAQTGLLPPTTNPAAAGQRRETQNASLQHTMAAHTYLFVGLCKVEPGLPAAVLDVQGPLVGVNAISHVPCADLAAPKHIPHLGMVVEDPGGLDAEHKLAQGS